MMSPREIFSNIKLGKWGRGAEKFPENRVAGVKAGKGGSSGSIWGPKSALCIHRGIFPSSALRRIIPVEADPRMRIQNENSSPGCQYNLKIPSSD